MTLETLFVLVVPVYLVLVAYGQVGARKRGLSPKMRGVTGAIRVAVPPVALVLAFLSTGMPRLLAAWGLVIVGMAVIGAIVAVVVEVVAPRVGA